MVLLLLSISSSLSTIRGINLPDLPGPLAEAIQVLWPDALTD